jgi:WD40 repeat protein/serine/threonine protein kinase
VSADQLNPDEPQSLSILKEIDRACDGFEIAWRADEKPRIEDYVAQASEHVRIDLLRELLRVEIACRLERHETILAQDYTPRFPEHGSLIDTLLAVHASADLGDELAHAGRYRLEGRIGRGGMGDVYHAHDSDFRRPLAVKVLKQEFKDRPELVARFLEEAQITGQLQHPGVPPVHEIGGLSDGRPFLAMKLIEGRTLADLLSNREAPSDDQPRFLTIFEQICQTLAYAHSRHIIHRDLKPLNIMVGAFGEVQVMDWGLAKRLASAEEPKELAINTNGSTHAPDLLETILNPTRPGNVMGTLAYMPPEQACGEVDRLDERSDVFSLGATLCEILTGDPPYRAPSSEKRWEQAKTADLADTYARLDACGADAELVLLTKRSLSRLKGDRPSNAAAVAEAVTAYQAGVQERLRRAELERTEAQVRAKESRKRRRVAVALGSLVLFVLIVGIAATLSQYQRVVEQRDDLDKEIGLKKIALTEARENLYVAQTDLVRNQYEATNIEHVRELLANCVPKNEAEKDLRGFEWHYWNHRTHLELLTFKGHTSPVAGVCFSPDSTRVASASLDGTIKVWDSASGQELLTLKGHGMEGDVCFSPDGTRLASASNEAGNNPGDVKVWDSTSGQELLTLKGHTGPVYGVRFSPDGTRLASASTDQTVKVWDSASGQELLTFKGHNSVVTGVCISPDGTRLASASLDSTLKVWDSGSGQELLTLSKGNNGVVEGVCFSPDGTRLASASYDHTVMVWDSTSGKQLLTLKGHTNKVWSVCFSPDGARLAAASEDQTVKVWDSTSGQELLTLKGHTGPVYGVCFSPDGTRLASASSDGTVKVWNSASTQELLTLGSRVRLHLGGVYGVCFSPDGRRLASVGDDGWTMVVKVWDSMSGQELLTLRGLKRSNSGGRICVCFSPDVTRLALASDDKTVRVWDSTSGQELLTLKGHTGAVKGVCFSPVGTRLASASTDQTVKVWDSGSGQELLTLKGHTGGVSSVCFSPDGMRLASAGFGKPGKAGEVKVWDSTSGQELLPLKGHTNTVWSVCFSPDGTRLASASSDQTVKVWDSTSGRELLSLKGHTNTVWSVCFSPDGTRLASASSDQTVKVWDSTSGRELLSLKGQTKMVFGVCFSPDGRRLASAADYTVKVWESTSVPSDTLRKRALVEKVDILFRRHLLKESVSRELRMDVWLSKADRRFALHVAQTHSEDPLQLHNAAWQIVRAAGGQKEAYAVALRYAEAAVRAAPSTGYYLNPRGTLGVAHYRVGDYANALQALTQSSQEPADLAFLAMAQHQLGKKDEAKATLARLRQFMKQPVWANNAEAQGFFGEAETLINGG